MRRSQKSRLSPYQVGLIALIVLVVAVFLGASKDIPFTRPFELKAVFENAPPILKNQSVRIAGVEVGKKWLDGAAIIARIRSARPMVTNAIC